MSRKTIVNCRFEPFLAPEKIIFEFDDSVAKMPPCEHLDMVWDPAIKDYRCKGCGFVWPKGLER